FFVHHLADVADLEVDPVFGGELLDGFEIRALIHTDLSGHDGAHASSTLEHRDTKTQRHKEYQPFLFVSLCLCVLVLVLIKRVDRICAEFHRADARRPRSALVSPPGRAATAVSGSDRPAVCDECLARNASARE